MLHCLKAHFVKILTLAKFLTIQSYGMLLVGSPDFVLFIAKLFLSVLTMNTDLAELKKHVASMSGGLDAKIYEGGKIHTHHARLVGKYATVMLMLCAGSNLSQGQKQLVSLA